MGKEGRFIRKIETLCKPKMEGGLLMQHEHVEVECITHNYYNSSTKPKFYKNTRLVGKII